MKIRWIQDPNDFLYINPEVRFKQKSTKKRRIRDNLSYLSLLLMGNSSGRLVQRHRPDVQLLYLVDRSDRYRRVGRQGQAVGIRLRVQRTHVIDLFHVDIRKDQLVIGGIDDGWAVRTRENVHGAQGTESPEHGRLRA